MHTRKTASDAALKTVVDNRGGPRHLRARPGLTPASARTSTITVRVPLSMQQRGARKIVVSPAGHTHWTPQPADIDDALVKAIARAHRWSRMLEGDQFVSMTELAKAEGVTASYLARILRLTLLSPKIVEALLDGQSGRLPQLQQILEPFSILWNQQETEWFDRAG